MQEAGSSLVNNSILHLLNFTKYSNFQEAAREAAINNNFQIVFFAEDFNVLFSVETRHTARIEDVVPLSIQAGISHSTKNVKISYGGVQTYWGPVILFGKKYYLMLVDNEDAYTQEEIVQLAAVIELAMGMWHFSPQRNPATELISAARRGNRELCLSLMQEFEIKESELAGIFYVPDISKDKALPIFTEFEKRLKVKSLKYIEGNELAGILLKNPFSKVPPHEEWKTLSRTFAPVGAPKTFYVLDIENVDDLCSAFKMISETEAFVQLIFPHKHSFSKYELAMATNCVSICLKSSSTKRYYSDLLKPLRKEEGIKGKQLMDTLEVFILDAGMSNSKAARLMDIHVNTVQYRLKRIKEILGVDINANTIVPGLTMALAVSRIEREVKSL